MMKNRHGKAVKCHGFSYLAAPHDGKRMDEARAEVEKANKAEAERASKRRVQRERRANPTGAFISDEIMRYAARALG